ncbi:MAG: A/G-specific adenine glycosylase, partial [Planctomycetota bacterium]
MSDQPLRFEKQRAEDARWRARVRRRLLDWFAEHQRDLPWRQHRDPYMIWISEIMLQQTQVATVIPYFNRFAKRFPDVQSLADVEEAELLRMWEGLGYYRRARQMHAAAQQIVQQHGGIFPTSFEEVLALPGIGRYTAGAVLSISQDQRLPVVEANTQRVYSRWIAMQNPPSQPAAMRRLWEFA